MLVIAVSTVLAFQNCGTKGPGAIADNNSSGGSGQPPPGPGGNPPIGNENFKKGEAFNYAYIPNKSQMVEVMINVFGYYGYSGAKAVAIASSGLGFVTRKAAGAQDDANRTALEGCFAISGGQPCALVAVGNAFNLNRNDLNNSYTFTMSQPLTIDANSLPFINLNNRATVAAQYNASLSPKALAVSVDGAYAWVAHTTQFPITSVQEARRVAMERCEMMAALSPCTLVAENSTVVFNPALINRTPLVEYLRLTMANNIPGMRDQVFSQAMTNDYLPKVAINTNRGAIYITADGKGGYGISTTESVADADALQACQQVQGNFPCFKYAVNNVVQNIAPNLTAIKFFSLETHCKSVPRLNCAHHKAMGCPGGMYYTTATGPVVLENCL